MIKVGDRIDSKDYGFGLGTVVFVKGDRFMVRFDNTNHKLHDGTMLGYKGGVYCKHWYFTENHLKLDEVSIVKTPSLSIKIKSFFMDRFTRVE